MKISDSIQNLRPYTPGKPIEETQRELGLDRVYKLASNENPLGPSPKVLEAIQAELSNLHRYPDAGFYKMRQAFSKKFGLSPESFTFGNGSNEIIDLLIRVFCSPGEAVLTSEKAFVAYGICASAARAEFITAPMQEDMKFDLEALWSAYEEHNAKTPVKLIFVANPNNPTGTYLTKEQLENFVAKFEGNNETLIVIDEAYLEFVTATDFPDAIDILKKNKNVVLTRTMSKVHGLAGIRVGSLMGDPEWIEYIDRIRNPFNVNNLAQVAAIVALDDDEYLERVQQVNAAGQEYFYSEFEKLGLQFWKSQTNFILVNPKQDGKALYQKLLEKGVIVRPMPLSPEQTYLRISIGTEEENQAAIAALTSVL